MPSIAIIRFSAIARSVMISAFLYEIGQYSDETFQCYSS